ncbi:MAG: helix-turn-helix transcriptional regulator [Candidatus Coatesbacteria bacterium]|nr:MAG: helix-turn-helix transcriptional regulator [Candidatus Coatesbacteria bacterium]
MLKLGEKVKKLRLARGYTQSAFASELGISPGYLSQIEMGLRNPSRELIKKMADTFGASLDYLMREQAPPAMKDVPEEIVEFFRSQHVTESDREELLAFFRFWQTERARRAKASREKKK